MREGDKWMVLENLKLEDGDGNEIKEIAFNVVYKDESSDVKIIYLRNNSNQDIYGVSVRPALRGEGQRGEEIETVNSTFISVDGIDFFPFVVVAIPKLSKIPLYFKWQPTYLADYMEYIWNIELFYNNE
jgi:hypothetical protein